MEELTPLFQSEQSIQPAVFSEPKSTETAHPWTPSPPRPKAPPAPRKTAVEDRPQTHLQDDALNALNDIKLDGQVPPDRESNIGPEGAMNPTEASNQEMPMTAEQQLQRAFAEGVEHGKKEAIDALEEERTLLQQQVAQSLHTSQRLTVELSRTYRREAVDLAASIAKAVLGSETVLNTSFIHTAVERVLTTLPRCQELVIQCHPDDVETMVQYVPDLKKLHGQLVTVHVSPDRNVDRGGIVVDFGEGTLDTQPSVAVDVLREAIERDMAQSNENLYKAQTSPTETAKPPAMEPEANDPVMPTPSETIDTPSLDEDAPSETPDIETVEANADDHVDLDNEPSEENDQ